MISKKKKNRERKRPRGLTIVRLPPLTIHHLQIIYHCDRVSEKEYWRSIQIFAAIFEFVKTTRILYATRSMGRVENIEKQGAVQVPPPPLKRPVGPFLIYYKKQLELMKSKGIVDKISTTVKKEIREKWMNLNEDSKLEYKKEARENSEKYANLSHNIPRKARKVSLYTRCAPNRVHLMVSNLNERQRFVLREMGFGSMLDLRSIQLNRDFCKWLVDHFDHNSCALDICGRRLPISTKDVEFILGVKSSRVDVSIVASAEEINHICQQHGLNVVGDIPINLLEGKLKEMKTSGKEFLISFLRFCYHFHLL
ncbi:hypothetical protein ACB092_03G109300 [Castanea dentata]